MLEWLVLLPSVDAALLSKYLAVRRFPLPIKKGEGGSRFAVFPAAPSGGFVLLLHCSKYVCRSQHFLAGALPFSMHGQPGLF